MPFQPTPSPTMICAFFFLFFFLFLEIHFTLSLAAYNAGRVLKVFLIKSITDTIQLTPPPPAPVAHRQIMNDAQFASPQSQQQLQSKQESEIQAALKDIRTSLQRSKVMTASNSPSQPLYNTTNNNPNNNNVSNLISSNSYYDRTPVIPEKVEDSPAMSLSPVWIPR